MPAVSNSGWNFFNSTTTNTNLFEGRIETEQENIGN